MIGVWSTAVNPGGTPSFSTAAGRWLTRLGTPASNWLVQKIQTTRPVAASRQ